MIFGGLGARAAHKQKSTKPCSRCSLWYPEDEASCIHCKDISDDHLETFKRRIEAQHESNAKLGRTFIVIAMVLGLLLFFSF